MDAIAGLDEEGFRLRPREGEWTAAEILAHLWAAEGLYVGRVEAALTTDDLLVTVRDEAERESDAKLAQRVPVPQIIHGLLAQRRDTLRRLRELSPEQLGRRLRHPQHGDVTIAWLFQRLAEHEEEHAEQIRSQRAQPAARQA